MIIENIKTVNIGGKEKQIILIGNYRTAFPVRVICDYDKVVSLFPVCCPFIPLDEHGHQTVNTEFRELSIAESEGIISELRHRFTDALIITDDIFVAKIYGIDRITVVKEVPLYGLPQ